MSPTSTGDGVNGGNGLYETSSSTSFLLPPPSPVSTSGEMMLLEKQGRASQQQRMQDNGSSSSARQTPSPAANANFAAGADSLPPSSLPRPPRSSNSQHRSGLPRRLGDYNRLPESDPPRKKSDGGESLSSNASSRKGSPARSLIPPPRKLGEYGRLSESGGSSSSLRKSSGRSTRISSAGERDSASTISDNSANSLPPPSKMKLYGGVTRRGSSLGRDSKSSTDSTASKYRIQF